jgi:hypothetical protein
MHHQKTTHTAPGIMAAIMCSFLCLFHQILCNSHLFQIWWKTYFFFAIMWFIDVDGLAIFFKWLSYLQPYFCGAQKREKKLKFWVSRDLNPGCQITSPRLCRYANNTLMTINDFFTVYVFIPLSSFTVSKKIQIIVFKTSRKSDINYIPTENM